MSTLSTKEKEANECLTLRVQDCAEILGVGRSTIYDMARKAEKNNGKPFKVIRIGSALLISKKSFLAYLQENNL